MIWYIILALSTIVSLLTGGKLWWALSRYAYRPIKASTTDNDLPTVSVCIAARNEMHALAHNLEHVLASDYKKLEILVLDDNSTDDTPLIIKSFAHAGVRFIAGRPLPAGWLGRNHAYQTLAEEASGDVVLYLDVDTILGSASISQLVTQLIANDNDMVSVLPRRDDNMRSSALFGTLRYMWELILASPQSPPTSSALWMIRRSRLLSLDKPLGEYGLSVRPEQHIAKALQATKDYYCLIASHGLQVSFEKRWHSQVETAERMYLPLFGRTLTAILMATGMFISLILPIVLFAFLSPQSQLVMFLWSFAIIVINVVVFGRYVTATHGTAGLFIRTFLWPYLISQEAILYFLSIVRYATKTVTWKGRPVLGQPANNSHYEINE